GRRHRLGRIFRIRRRGRGGTAVEIFVVLELLPDQGGADHLAVRLDQAALCLPREDDAGNPRDDQRISETGDQGQRQQEDDGGTNFTKHCRTSKSSCVIASEAKQSDRGWKKNRIASSLRSSQ